MTRVVGSVVTGDPAKHWLAKFANLNAEPDRGRGVAPHKPLLLFCGLAWSMPDCSQNHHTPRVKTRLS